MKYIVLLGDGMADYALDALGGKTPLQAGRTPAMDLLARKGRLGCAATIPPGMAPGSDVANLAVLGYDPRRFYGGRAPIEAAGLGIALGPEDVAFRCNLVTLQQRDSRLVMEDYSAGHIATGDAAAVIQAMQSHLAADALALFPGISYRHLLVWKSGCAGMCTTPPHDITGKPIDDFLPRGEGAETITRLMERSRTALADLPLNRARISRGEKPVTSLWLWGQGKALALPTFREKYGLRGSVISAVDLVKGLGICAGLSPVTVPGATGYLDTNYAGKASAALEALESVDFVYLHVEAPDEASHNGSLADKIQAIEDFDQKIVGPVMDGLARRFPAYRILLMPDHATPLATRTHAADPVPFVICSSEDVRKDAACAAGYNEPDAAASGLLVAEGWTLMDLFLKG